MFTSLARGYATLSSTGAPQSAVDTIDKLCDRLLNDTNLEDRRAALLGLKGLSRDWKTVCFVSYGTLDVLVCFDWRWGECSRGYMTEKEVGVVVAR